MKKTTIDVEKHRPLRWLLPDIIINNTDVSSSRDDTATRAATVCYTTKTGTYTARETLDARDPQHCSSAAADGLFLLAEIATRRRRSFRLLSCCRAALTCETRAADVHREPTRMKCQTCLCQHCCVQAPICCRYAETGLGAWAAATKSIVGLMRAGDKMYPIVYC